MKKQLNVRIELDDKHLIEQMAQQEDMLLTEFIPKLAHSYKNHLEKIAMQQHEIQVLKKRIRELENEPLQEKSIKKILGDLEAFEDYQQTQEWLQNHKNHKTKVLYIRNAKLNQEKRIFKKWLQEAYEHSLGTDEPMDFYHMDKVVDYLLNLIWGFKN